MPGPDARGGGWDVRAICAITVRRVVAVPSIGPCGGHGHNPTVTRRVLNS